MTGRVLICPLYPFREDWCGHLALGLVIQILIQPFLKYYNPMAGKCLRSVKIRGGRALWYWNACMVNGFCQSCERCEMKAEAEECLAHNSRWST